MDFLPGSGGLRGFSGQNKLHILRFGHKAYRFMPKSPKVSVYQNWTPYDLDAQTEIIRNMTFGKKFSKKVKKKDQKLSPLISDKKLSKWEDILKSDKWYQNNEYFDQSHSYSEL